MRVLDCLTKEELASDDIAILQANDGNLFYCERLQSRHEECVTNLYVKRGAEVIAELLYDEIDVIAVFGNEIAFTSKGKIYKAAVDAPKMIVSFVRDLHKNEKVLPRGICSKIDYDKMYIYRLIDDPMKEGILIDITAEEREKLTLYSIHRGKAIFLAQKPDIDGRIVRMLREQIIVAELNEVTPSWSWSDDSSPFIYFGDHSVMHTVDVETMEFPRPLRFEHLHHPVIRSIESIVGVHNGVMSMICVKTDGKSYLMTAKLPVRYYLKKEPIAQSNERVED
ncbi:hypothetical protein PRIPAC_80491 [Pristionchus pacificus]|uniref:Uncharacterized protein n=1 Tax=Pristionchus pacificus TaxID=54126 RepID=A0A2A6BXT3_PRIPA|nr:hypothetical protein PRIPAC_80491 [Pristionchus pacificus]|eukprot:PDM70812.1 hypothetical protein PRIPAC_45016 [Pristionchus pacificus]